MFVPRLNMDRDYTVVGRVIGGMGYIDAIERGEPPLSPTPDRPRLDRFGQCAGHDRRGAPRRGRADGRRRAPGHAGHAAAASIGPAVPPPPAPPRELEPARGPQRRPPGG